MMKWHLSRKKVFSFLPKFFVEVNGQEVLTIKKEFSFLKARYSIDAAGIEVNGNWWDMNFEVLQHGKVVGKVSKQWFTWGDSYEVQIVDEEMETIVIALVVAIDCVKALRRALPSSIQPFKIGQKYKLLMLCGFTFFTTFKG